MRGETTPTVEVELSTWIRSIGAIAVLATACALLPSPSAGQLSTLEIEVEGGPVWLSRNVAEIPNDGTGTRLSLTDLTGAGPWLAGRAYLTWNLSDTHGVRVLYAPLSITEVGTLPGAASFAGATYSGSTPLEASYTFNSYRATYRWRFHSSADSRAWVGLTAKVRDASIGLVQGSTNSRKDDVGFVPLLHFAAERRLGTGWHLLFDADALAGGPGRAIDGTVKVGYDLDDRWSVRAGYRTVEGGADVESVYNFAWLHYAAVSVVWRMPG